MTKGWQEIEENEMSIFLILRGIGGHPARLQGQDKQSPEGTNENTAFLNLKIMIFNAKIASTCRQSFGTGFIG